MPATAAWLVILQNVSAVAGAGEAERVNSFAFALWPLEDGKHDEILSQSIQ